MSYATVKAGLIARLATVTNPETIKVNIDYEPTSAQASPLVYSILDSCNRERAGGNEVRVTWRTLHRLCILWQDSAQAETTLDAFADSIPAAIEAAEQLSGVLMHGVAKIFESDADWVMIGGTEYRSLDFYSEVTELVKYAGGW